MNIDRLRSRNDIEKKKIEDSYRRIKYFLSVCLRTNDNMEKEKEEIDYKMNERTQLFSSDLKTNNDNELNRRRTLVMEFE